MTRVLFLSLGIAVFAACAGVTYITSGMRVNSFREEVLPRVAFEFGCPQEKIEVVDLTPQNDRWYGAQMGVSGCEKKAAYTCVKNAGWVNNTGVESKAE